MKRWWSGVLVATIGVAACLDYSTDPDVVVAIEFLPLPSPSIVAGDTLRDESGAAVPMAARLFNSSGEEITGPVDFFAQQPILHVTDGDLLVADPGASGPVGVFASTIGVQSVTQQVIIVGVPATLSTEGLIAPLEWVVPDSPAENTRSGGPSDPGERHLAGIPRRRQRAAILRRHYRCQWESRTTGATEDCPRTDSAGFSDNHVERVLSWRPPDGFAVTNGSSGAARHGEHFGKRPLGGRISHVRSR